MNHKYIVAGLFLIIVSSLSFAHYYTGSLNDNPNVIQFEDSNWNYVVGYGFVTDDAVEVLEQQDFTQRSRDYFLGEIS